MRREELNWRLVYFREWLGGELEQNVFLHYAVVNGRIDWMQIRFIWRNKNAGFF